MLDAFHIVKVVKLGTRPSPRSGDGSGRRPRVTAAARTTRYPICTILRCGAENLTDRQRAGRPRDRHRRTTRRGRRRLAVRQKLRAAYKVASPTEGRRIAEEELLNALPTCPIAEIRRLRNTLNQWRAAFLAYLDTSRASNGGTEAIKRSDRTAPPWRAAASAIATTTDYACCSSAPVLGIIRSRTGNGWKLRFFRLDRSSSRKSSTPCPAATEWAVRPSTPAVRAPLLPRTRSQATNKKAGSATRLNRSSNRR